MRGCSAEEEEEGRAHEHDKRHQFPCTAAKMPADIRKFFKPKSKPAVAKVEDEVLPSVSCVSSPLPGRGLPI